MVSLPLGQPLRAPRAGAWRNRWAWRGEIEAPRTSFTPKKIYPGSKWELIQWLMIFPVVGNPVGVGQMPVLGWFGRFTEGGAKRAIQLRRSERPPYLLFFLSGLTLSS
jgi:hypothetical protein